MVYTRNAAKQANDAAKDVESVDEHNSPHDTLRSQVLLLVEEGKHEFGNVFDIYSSINRRKQNHSRPPPSAANRGSSTPKRWWTGLGHQSTTPRKTDKPRKPVECTALLRGRFRTGFFLILRCLQKWFFHHHRKQKNGMRGFVTAPFGTRLSNCPHTLDNVRSWPEATVFRVVEDGMSREKGKAWMRIQTGLDGSCIVWEANWQWRW